MIWLHERAGSSTVHRGNLLAILRQQEEQLQRYGIVHEGQFPFYEQWLPYPSAETMAEHIVRVWPQADQVVGYGYRDLLVVPAVSGEVWVRALSELILNVDHPLYTETGSLVNLADPPIVNGLVEQELQYWLHDQNHSRVDYFLAQQQFPGIEIVLCKLTGLPEKLQRYLPYTAERMRVNRVLQSFTLETALRWWLHSLDRRRVCDVSSGEGSWLLLPGNSALGNERLPMVGFNQQVGQFSLSLTSGRDFQPPYHFRYGYPLGLKC
jgi:hypothetical protein